MSKRVSQQILGLVAPKRSRGAARFERETIRRGGPYEVEGKRRRNRREEDAEEMGEGGWAKLVGARLKRMPK